MRSRSRHIAVLGGDSPLGRSLVTALVATPGIERVIALDPGGKPGSSAKSKSASAKALVRPVDLDQPETLAEAIDKDDVDTLVHLGYLVGAGGQGDSLPALEAIAEALGRRPIPKLVFTSSTTIYRSLPGDPTNSDEDTLLADDARSAWVQDKVKADRRIRSLTMEVDAAVTCLRFGLVVGTSVETFIVDYLRRRAVPVVDGQDPSLQCVHEKDVVSALVHAVCSTCEGTFNIVGEGALPLSMALRAGRRRVAPVPELGSYPMHPALWEADLDKVPEPIHDLFHYHWMADGSRAQDELRFQTAISSRETVEDFYRRLDAKA